MDITHYRLFPQPVKVGKEFPLKSIDDRKAAHQAEPGDKCSPKSSGGRGRRQVRAGKRISCYLSQYKIPTQKIRLFQIDLLDRCFADPACRYAYGWSDGYWPLWQGPYKTTGSLGPSVTSSHGDHRVLFRAQELGIGV